MIEPIEKHLLQLKRSGIPDEVIRQGLNRHSIPIRLAEEGLTTKEKNKFKNQEDKVKEEIDFFSKRDIKFCSIYQDTYPLIFRRGMRTPVCFWYKGDLTLLNAVEYQDPPKTAKPIHFNTVAIVGSRACEKQSLELTNAIVDEMVKRNKVILSGLAKGIDGQAHKRCLDVGGKTVAFVPTALTDCYPAEHQELLKEIEEKGLVISTFGLHETVGRETLFERTRTLLHSTEIVIVPDGKPRSGTSFTVREASQQSYEYFTFDELKKEIYLFPQAQDVVRELKSNMFIVDTLDELLERIER